MRTKPFDPDDTLTPNQRVDSEGDVASMIPLTHGGSITDLLVTNLTAHAGYVQLFDSAVLPANATVPLISLPMEKNTTVVLDTPIRFVHGLTIAISTTGGTLTISTNLAFMFANIRD